MKTRLSARGQVVIPKDVREQLSWGQGQDLTVEIVGDGIVLRPAGEPDESWRRWRGALEGTDVWAEMRADRWAELEKDEHRFGPFGH